MFFPFKTKRSAGVPVTRAVHRMLSRANTARDQRRWADAASAYREALRTDGTLTHIWVQLGNMLKEAGNLPEAGQAYQRAFTLRSQDPEPMLQLGGLHLHAGELAAAGLCFERAYAAAPRSAQTAAGLRRALSIAPAGAESARLASMLLGDRSMPDIPADPVGKTTDHPRILHLDISDLLEFWYDGRLPTGIQRVQTQVLLAALKQPGRPVALCALVQGRQAFRPVCVRLATAAAALSLEGGDVDDPEWIACLDHLSIQVAQAKTLACRPGDVLVGLGSSWNMRDYFPALRDLKSQAAISYVPLVYDLTPLITPQFFTVEARADFSRWAPEMLAHAAGAVTISQATRRDLLDLATRSGRPLDAASVEVMPLNVDTRLGTATLPATDLRGWSLQEGGFVLFVATIEPRKGHVVAIEAWSRLMESPGAQPVPKLVCVGKRGWLTSEIDRHLQANPRLADTVVFLGALGDAELDLLYRSCLFTIYPSFYEGWGLPVTESLCRCKVVVTTTSSALPEAGGAFALYVEPGDSDGLALQLTRLLSEEGFRAAREAHIAAHYRPTSWDATALHLQTVCLALTSR